MKYRDYLIIFFLPLFLISSFILAYFLIGLENYNYIYPHIDTEFTSGFSKDKFKKIKLGMTKAEVNQVLGEPFRFQNLNGYTDDFIKKEFQFSENYSHDGKFKSADWAWEYFGIYYDKDTLVIAKQTRWYYD